MSATTAHGITLGDAAKRLVDVVGTVVLLVCLAPLFVLLAALVACSSPGPIFFCQQRVGRGERLFWMYKFRSMHVAPPGISVTAASDPRITRIGSWLRKYKLDELPQLLNVLRGDMSLVGPRPEVTRYVERYTPEQREVLTVRPGVTGLTQLSFRNEEALLAGQWDVEAYYVQMLMPAKLRLDLQYVRNRSLIGDLALMLQTVVVLSHCA